MDNLITVAEFAEYRHISKKLNTDKIEEAIRLAQTSDLVAILGDFYFDVLKNKDETTYAPLMDGGYFTDDDGEEYYQEGIKRMLADYVYGRYIYTINANPTPFGMQAKYTDDSNPIDRNQIKDLSKQGRADAGVKFVYIEKYILTEPTLFSRYCRNKHNKTSFNGLGVSIVGRSHKADKYG